MHNVSKREDPEVVKQDNDTKQQIPAVKLEQDMGVETPIAKLPEDDDVETLKAKLESKRNYINYIFHEVRQPFTILSLGLEHIQTVCNTATGPDHGTVICEVRETLQELIDASKSMSRILDDVLILEKLQAMKMKVETAPHQINDILHYAKLHTSRLFEAKDIQVHTHVAEDLDNVVAHYDHCRIAQVMFNFLTNAAKFTSRGGNVRLHLQHVQPGEDDAHPAGDRDGYISVKVKGIRGGPRGIRTPPFFVRTQKKIGTKKKLGQWTVAETLGTRARRGEALITAPSIPLVCL